MSAHVSSTQQRRRAPKTMAWRLLAVLSAATLGFSWLAACGSSDNGGNSTDTSSSSSGGGSNSGSGGNSSGSKGSSSGTSTGGTSSGNGGASSGSSGTSSGGGASSGNSSGASSGGGGNSSGTSSGSTGSSSGAGSSSGVKDGGGGDSTVGGGDGGGPACTNTNQNVINIDSSGWVCNNKWNIQGSWYCYNGGGTSDCTNQGDIPYNPTSNPTANAMCIGGTTGSPPSSTVFGAGLGLVLNQADHDAGKSAFNASAQQIVGFAITLSGDSGGSTLNINFPSPTSTGEVPSVTVPGVASGNSPITYSVLFSDAIISDNTTAFPAPTVNPASIGDVQVAIHSEQVAHTYSFCVTNIVPITAAPAAPAAFGNYGPAFNNEVQVVLEGLGQYGIQNDVTAANSMSMQAMFGGGQIGFSATPNFSTGNVGAFPSIVYGWIHGGNFVGGTHAGAYTTAKQISGLGSVITSWSYTPGSGNWDAAYDVWFGGNPNSINAAAELMVWLGHNNVGPVGGLGSATFTTAGITWGIGTGNVTDSNGNHPVVTYVAPSNLMTTPAGFDLLPFFKDAAMNTRAGTAITPSSYLLGVQTGFELYNGGTWKTNSFSISAQ